MTRLAVCLLTILLCIKFSATSPLALRDDEADVCFRWAHQSAIVNGTLYIYGGQASTEEGQDSNTWNNNFLSLDLTKSWQIAAPPLQPQPQPNGPPPVALGHIWNSYDSLYLYGGEFSWKPPVTPTEFSLWEYKIASRQWKEHSNPKTSKGVSSPSDGDPVQRSAEGAGVSVPSLGRGFYFGGHQDGYTTEGWSQSIPRIYLQSLLEYTFPGAKNDQTDASSGSDGVYRNITEGGLQASHGFTKRADGLLVYVPGFGKQGILLALAGGTNDTFTQMNNIDIYDIATSSWSKQATTGPTPKIRVNPCAVAASAADGSSTNIYMFGGQNLIPYGDQTLYNDLWILTLPSFTWIQVNQGGQSVPYARSGHTCNVWNAQMVVVGGYVGTDLSCESPGIYVFDLSTTQWVTSFTAGDKSNDAGTRQNPLNQQSGQKANASDAGGLEGSYGYAVPQIVIDVIGGNANGGATVTKPAVAATNGPLATGKPKTFSTPSGATPTGSSGSSSKGGDSSSDSGTSTGGASSQKKSKPNIAAIVVGTLCGVLALIAIYLAFCAYLYRKQVALYKHHLEMARAEKEEYLANHPYPAASSSDGVSNRYGSQRTSTTRHKTDTSEEHVDDDDDDDLLAGQEPSFVGVVLNPRRSLRVMNR
ncbi:hypothetical protein K470DRAFT_242443 [Piedraia hortae CBS 480.64]|uniref:Galactose oxidase n=1 Tax=Piedraia hortae CBS 480.64 TaxID=1314780 RepID=A0A6A7C6H5_9PEZI|nr:hypothetical protein K470DRAFT_242443 [Piedraia hortae CBS 480.64]